MSSVIEELPSASEAGPIELTIMGSVGRIMLRREGKLNALTSQLRADLLTALEECERRDEVKSIVFVGHGGNFCAGADIDEMIASGDGIVTYMQDTFALFTRIEECSKPLIAQIDGYCLGGGFELAIACDVIVASERARFGLPETTFGLVPGFAIQRLPAMVGVAAASNFLLGGRFTSASAARDLGLLQRVVAGDRLDAEVDEVTDHLARLDRTAVAVAKEALRAHRRHASNLDHSAWANASLFASESTQSALLAFGGRGRGDDT